MGKLNLYDTQKQTIVELQSRIRAWERGASLYSTHYLKTGCGALDTLFPGQGVRQGSLVEWLGDGNSSGAGTVSLITGWRVCPAGRPLVLIDTRHDLFPLSLSLLGFDLSRLILIRPASKREALWACEEALRCEAVGVVWANIEQITSTSFRRLQLAAEDSAGIGFLVRSAKAVHQPSWAEVRFKVYPRPSLRGSPGFQVEVISHHGKPHHSMADIMIDSWKGTLYENRHSANPLPLVPRMDAPATYRRSTGT
ncbi:conserved hypothetical protein [Planctopirus limnophila DSM 3776]|uniref:Recombinase A n=1 Tax=Planctopirus limnophila (strain ATCC 43296 / DSM 3776 / IFAM 1008 / Mu 290) TaxID=521674 RepID=D5SV91_PLAL2|nr:hypothetical protein [Planctopirus limnophila]ADG67161.1 conserved hypothetical protein [Planctopirus limnophila DSM 3776]